MQEITAIKNGSEDAFVEAYQQLHVKLFRFFLKRMKTQDIAQDLTQQTFIRLWQYRHNLSEAFSLDTQVFTIANTVMVDHLRKQASERKHQTALTENMNTEVLYIEHPVKSFEVTDYLEAAVNNLPPVRKKIILLRVMHGLTNKEISGQLSISIKTVEDHITKALRHIKERY